MQDCLDGVKICILKLVEKLLGFKYTFVYT